MKSLISNGQVFEPFSVVEKKSDHYLCDGIIYPFAVLGSDCTIVDYVAPDIEPTTTTLVPERVKPLQLDLALIELNYYDAVHDYAATGTSEEKARFNRAEWMYRNDPFLVSGAKSLGLTDAQIDEVFILAGTK